MPYFDQKRRDSCRRETTDIRAGQIFSGTAAVSLITKYMHFKTFFIRLGAFSSPLSNGSSEIAIGFFPGWIQIATLLP